MRNIHRSLRWLAAVVLAAGFLGDASASAFEAHNFIEPPFGSFKVLGGLAVNQANGNVYATEVVSGEESGHPGEVKVFGREGGVPAGGGPSSFTGAGSFEKFFWPRFSVAVDPSSGYVYVLDFEHRVVDKYILNNSKEYEYVCEFAYYPAEGKFKCVAGPEGAYQSPGGSSLHGPGLTVDSAGDVYIPSIAGYSKPAIFEFNAAGEELQMLALPGLAYSDIESLAVSSSGTIYILRGEEQEVLELKRSSLTGPVEGAPAVVPHTQGVTGVAFDRANGELFVDLGSYAEALNSAYEIVSRFGAGVISRGRPIAVNEATGEVYVGNGTEHNIDRFGPGVVATLPAVDAPPPSLSDVTRTSALISPTINPHNATTTWRLEYVAAGEYQPAAANPYANGGSTAQTKLAAGREGIDVGPLPLTGLLAGTTYHYRLVATNELGTTYGQDHTFTTAPATPPVVTTGAASEVTQTGVLLSGTVGTRELQTSYVFEVGTDTSYGGAKLFGNAGSGGTEAVSAGLQFLIPGTIYHYRLAASNQDGTSYGQDMTFTTPPVSAPIVQPPAPALIPSPAVTFPSVVGAITKPVGAGNGHKKQAKKRRAKVKSKHRRKKR